MDKDLKEAILALRTQGFAVVVFSPEELKRADPGSVENRLVELGNEVIEVLKGPAQEEEAVSSDLTGILLDWAVARSLEYPITIMDGGWAGDRFEALVGGSSITFSPSTNWAQAGPIIREEGISLIRQTSDRWTSEYSGGCSRPDHARAWGSTPLVSAMRCFVMEKLGDIIQVPAGLME